MNERIDFTTRIGNSISVVSFGAIDHLSTLLKEVKIKSFLLILDSKTQQVFPKGITDTPSIIDFDQHSDIVLQELEKIFVFDKKDSIIVVSDQKGINYVKVALYLHLQSKKEVKPLIIIPTTYTTTHTLSTEILFYTKEQKSIECMKHPALQPMMVVIDERAISNISAREKALSVIAILGGFIDVLHHTPQDSYEYFLAIQGISICKEIGYKAAHSPHDSNSRQELLFASHLLSLVRLQVGNGILETMVDILHKVSDVSGHLLMNTILPFMMDVVKKGNNNSFISIAEHVGFSSFSDFIQQIRDSILEPLPSKLPERLYDIIEGEIPTHLITLSHIQEASHLVFQQKSVSLHPSIIDEQDIIRYYEAAFWGYSLPKEWV